MFCMFCGEELPNDSIFCTKCGRKLVTFRSSSPAPNADDGPDIRFSMDDDDYIDPIADEPAKEEATAEGETAASEDKPTVDNESVEEEMTEEPGTEDDAALQEELESEPAAMGEKPTVIDLNVDEDAGSKNSKRKKLIAALLILLFLLIVGIVAWMQNRGNEEMADQTTEQTEEQEQADDDTEESVGDYITSSADLTAERLSGMQDHAASVLSIELKNETSDAETIKEMTYLGNYTLVNKNYDVNGGYHNILYLVYYVTTENSSQTEVGNYYWYMGYHDVLIKASDDTSKDYTATATPTVTTGSYFGFASLEELYQNVVKDNREIYIFEDNVEDIEHPEEVIEEPVAEPEPQQEEQTQEQEEQQEEQTTVSAADGQIFPNSSSAELTDEQIAGLSSSQIRYAINEIYARHGYIFNDASLQSYYEQYSWYTPTTSAGSFSESVFSITEQTNVMKLRAAQ